MQGLDLVEVFPRGFQVDVDDLLGLLLLHVLRRRLRDILISPCCNLYSLLPLLDELLPFRMEDAEFFGGAI